MGEYGLKIKNIVVGSLLEKNAGVREYMDMTDAMLCNSLFLDYLYSNLSTENDLIKIAIIRALTKYCKLFPYLMGKTAQDNNFSSRKCNKHNSHIQPTPSAPS